MIKEYIELCHTFNNDTRTIAAMQEIIIPYLEKQAHGWEHAEQQLMSHDAGQARMCRDKATEIRDALGVALEGLKRGRSDVPTLHGSRDYQK